MYLLIKVEIVSISIRLVILYTWKSIKITLVFCAAVPVMIGASKYYGREKRLQHPKSFVGEFTVNDDIDEQIERLFLNTDDAIIILQQQDNPAEAGTTAAGRQSRQRHRGGDNTRRQQMPSVERVEYNIVVPRAQSRRRSRSLTREQDLQPRGIRVTNDDGYDADGVHGGEHTIATVPKKDKLSQHQKQQHQQQMINGGRMPVKGISHHLSQTLQQPKQLRFSYEEELQLLRRKHFADKLALLPIESNIPGDRLDANYNAGANGAGGQLSDRAPRHQMTHATSQQWLSDGNNNYSKALHLDPLGVGDQMRGRLLDRLNREGSPRSQQFGYSQSLGGDAATYDAKNSQQQQQQPRHRKQQQLQVDKSVRLERDTKNLNTRQSLEHLHQFQRDNDAEDKQSTTVRDNNKQRQVNQYQQNPIALQAKRHKHHAHVAKQEHIDNFSPQDSTNINSKMSHSNLSYSNNKTVLNSMDNPQGNVALHATRVTLNPSSEREFGANFNEQQMGVEFNSTGDTSHDQQYHSTTTNARSKLPPSTQLQKHHQPATKAGSHFFAGQGQHTSKIGIARFDAKPKVVLKETFI